MTSIRKSKSRNSNSICQTTVLHSRSLFTLNQKEEVHNHFLFKVSIFKTKIETALKLLFATVFNVSHIDPFDPVRDNYVLSPEFL